MSQGRSNKLYRTFVKGLVTEASPLTYPEDTSLDECNTIPSRKGNRTRRYGMNYNPENVVVREYVSRNANSEFMWKAVGGNPGLSFLVVQNGGNISFYDRTQTIFADSKKSFEIDLTTYTRPGVSTITTQLCRFASGKGYLFIVNPDIEPLIVTYDKTADNVVITKIAILARDFEGLRDGLANDEEPSTLSKSHFYNLLNQGWVSTKTSGGTT